MSLSEDTKNLLARILLALAEGEKKVEDARKELASEDNYDIQAIFRALDSNKDNRITPKDIQKYLVDHQLEVNLIEVKLLILFYDQNHSFTLSYGEIFKIVHPGKQMPRLPKYVRDDEINVRVDSKLFSLLEQEIIMARIVLALLDEIKHKSDFDIHLAFHDLKYYACITGDSINSFLNKCGFRPTAGDVRAMVRRLDINKDDIIDFCEFHAFIGYPDCSYCCPCFPCPNCATKYCRECLQDIPCYLLGCNHKGMDSKMRCTSPEHSPRGGERGSYLDSLLDPRKGGSQSSTYGTSMRRGDEEDEKNDINSRMKGLSGNGYPPGYNGMNNGLYGRNGFGGRGLSPEQYNLLQGLTNPEQLNKFMTISGIMDRQKEGAINITNNLSLILSPIRDFDPKDWGCKNCPCNIHSNPNVSCDCCTCNVCPFTTNKNKNPEKQKQRKFPRVSLYSYSYTYEPDTSGPDKNQILNNILNNDPSAKKRLIFNKELNRYEKTMANSTDGEEYENYMKRQFDNNNIQNNRIMGNNIKRGGAGDNQSRSSGQDMIYSDQMSRQYVDNRSRNEENIQDENYVQQRELIDNRYREEIYKSISSQKRRGRGGSSGDDEDGNADNNGEGGIRGGPDGSNIIQPGQGQISQNYRISNSLSQIQRNPQQDLDQSGAGGRDGPRNPQQDFGQSGAGGMDGQRNPQQDFDQSGAGGRGGPQGSSMNPGDMPRGSQSLSSFFPGKTTTTIPPSNPQDDNDPLIRDSIYPSYSISPQDQRSQAGIGTSSVNPKDIPLSSTIYLSQKDKKSQKQIISGKDEEESIEDLGRSGLYRSHEEIIDENEQIFIKYLKLLIKSEKEIEFARRDLMRQPDYNAEDAFRLFEVEGRNLINKEDLKYGLTILGIKPTAAQIKLLMDRYDLDGNGYIDYDDFFDMVISFKDEDRQDEKKRIPNRSIRNRDINMFSPQTKELYRKLFLVIIEEEERLEKFREKLNVTNEIMSELFKKINANDDGICDKKEFANYCLRKGVCKEKKDAYLAFIRLNRNRDGGIEDKEFGAELSSSF